MSQIIKNKIKSCFLPTSDIITVAHQKHFKEAWCCRQRGERSRQTFNKQFLYLCGSKDFYAGLTLSRIILIFTLKKQILYSHFWKLQFEIGLFSSFMPLPIPFQLLTLTLLLLVLSRMYVNIIYCTYFCAFVLGMINTTTATCSSLKLERQPEYIFQIH